MFCVCLEAFNLNQINSYVFFFNLKSIMILFQMSLKLNLDLRLGEKNRLENNPTDTGRCPNTAFTHKPLNLIILFFAHLKLYLATATHNFKWVKITHMCLL